MDKFTQSVIFTSGLEVLPYLYEPMTFAKALKIQRLKLELTQAQAAQVLNDGDPDGSPCKRTVEEWEGGRRTPMLVAQEGVFARLRAYRAVPKFCDIPLYGEVPAGPLSDNPQLADEVLSVPADTYPKGAFGLRVRGESMIGKNIFDGDVIVCLKQEAKNGDVVVALIDGASTLKTLVSRNGKCELRSENPKCKKPVLTDQSIIQAVMIDKLDRASK